jgi:hypothetical protein
VLPSVAICFHVFTDSFSCFHISCIPLYHVPQSEYRFCSPSSILFPPSNSARLGPPSRRLVKQAPRLVVILPGSPLLLDPRLFLPFEFPPARNITRTTYRRSRCIRGTSPKLSLRWHRRAPLAIPAIAGLPLSMHHRNTDEACPSPAPSVLPVRL